MRVGRKSNFYRPYYVIASGREYQVDKIHFYKDSAILVSTNSGWLENKNGADIESIELPVDEIKVKRKESLDGKIFVISKGKELYGNDLIAELYIPANMFDVHFVRNQIVCKRYISAVYEGANDIFISSYVKSIDGELNNIRKQYEELYKSCEGYDFAYHTDDVIEKLDTLKNLAKQYLDEKQRVESLTIDDIEL